MCGGVQVFGCTVNLWAAWDHWPVSSCAPRALGPPHFGAVVGQCTVIISSHQGNWVHSLFSATKDSSHRGHHQAARRIPLHLPLGAPRPPRFAEMWLADLGRECGAPREIGWPELAGRFTTLPPHFLHLPLLVHRFVGPGVSCTGTTTGIRTLGPGLSTTEVNGCTNLQARIHFLGAQSTTRPGKRCTGPG